MLRFGIAQVANVLYNCCYIKTFPPSHSTPIVLVCLAELNGGPGKIQQAYLCLSFTQSSVVPLFYFVIANWRYFLIHCDYSYVTSTLLKSLDNISPQQT